MKKFIISIDAGTTSNRSILFDLKGKPIFSSQKEFTQYFPKNGWVEHDPEEIWKTTIKTLKDVIQKSKKIRGEIFAVLGFVFGMMGLVAFVRLEKLVKTLKEKGVLEEDYKGE